MKPGKTAPFSALGALLAAYLCIPLLASLPRIVTSDWAAVEWGALGDAAAISAASATLAAGLIAVGGIPLGYWLSRRRSRFASVVGFAVQLPLALPPLTSGILLLILIGPYSVVGHIFSGGLTDSFSGIVVASVFVASPFLIIAARSAFDGVDPLLEDVGATLGHGNYARFFNIALPLAWPAIRAGLLLSWLRAFGEFGATVMVAYHPYSLPVYTYVAFGSQGLPAMMPIILPTLLLALAATLAVAATSRQAWRRGTVDRNTFNPTGDSLVVNLGPQSANAHLCRHIDPQASHDLPPIIGNALNIPTALSFAFQKHMGPFSLDIAWTTSARRLAILGTSGSGKSLTLRLIAGLETADTARMTVAGEDYLCMPAERRQIAYVPQDYGLFPHMRVAQQWAFARDADMQAAHYWSQQLGLEGLAQRFPQTLSLGQRQRVSIVRALSRPCPLILLDEPFSALDTPRRRQLREGLRNLQTTITATTILVTHDPDEAALLADEVLVIDQGKVLQAGPTRAVFRQPATLRVAELLGLSNVGEGVMTAAGLLCLGSDPQSGAPILLKPSFWEHHPASGLQTNNFSATDTSCTNTDTPVLWRIDPQAVRITDNGLQAHITGCRLLDGLDYLIITVGMATLQIRQGREQLMVGGIMHIDIDAIGIQVWSRFG